MEEIIKKLVMCLKEVDSLKDQLNDKNYWIEKAKKEAGFVPKEDTWIHIEVTTWKIEVSVYPSYKGSTDGAKYWINGKWFDTSFPGSIPYYKNLVCIIEDCADMQVGKN